MKTIGGLSQILEQKIGKTEQLAIGITPKFSPKRQLLGKNSREYAATIPVVYGSNLAIIQSLFKMLRGWISVLFISLDDATDFHEILNIKSIKKAMLNTETSRTMIYVIDIVL